MSEVEKMYKNVGVEMEFAYLECHRGRSSFCCPIEEYEKDDECMGCINSSAMKKVYEYPPFTAEKQLLLLLLLLDKTDLYLHRHKTDFTYSIASGNFSVNKYKDFKESIAEFINAIWQDLTEEERKQIKEILE